MGTENSNLNRNILNKAMQALEAARKLQRDKLSLGADYVNVHPNVDFFQSGCEYLSDQLLINSEPDLTPSLSTPQMESEAIANAVQWLQNHPEADAVRTQYLTLVTSQGTQSQQQEAMEQTATWLASRTQVTSVWQKYLILVGKFGTAQQQQDALSQAANWLTSHQQDASVREQYLVLLGQVGTRQQQQEAIAQTSTWLESNTEDRYVREQYLALVGQVGTLGQKQTAVAETTVWLRSHLQDRYVREQYLTLVDLLGSGSTSPEETARGVNLRKLQQVLTSISEALDNLLDTGTGLNLAFRSSADRWEEALSQEITLDGQTIVLRIELRQEEEEKLSVRVQLEPVEGESYLPEAVKLILHKDSEVYEDTAGSDRELIEAVIPDCESGETFTIQVAIGDVSFSQDFTV